MYVYVAILRPANGELMVTQPQFWTQLDITLIVENTTHRTHRTHLAVRREQQISLTRRYKRTRGTRGTCFWRAPSERFQRGRYVADGRCIVRHVTGFDICENRTVVGEHGQARYVRHASFAPISQDIPVTSLPPRDTMNLFCERVRTGEVKFDGDASVDFFFLLP